jgi:hypothetical protein
LPSTIAYWRYFIKSLRRLPVYYFKLKSASKPCRHPPCPSSI